MCCMLRLLTYCTALGSVKMCKKGMAINGSAETLLAYDCAGVNGSGILFFVVYDCLGEIKTGQQWVVESEKS